MDPDVTGARTEEGITRNWEYSEPPLLSIRCTTYNHESYIRNAIEGFLMQETDFPFEIIIHDDASTDGTANIIREYEAKYPRLIKPIYQVENQYSKGLGRITRFLNEKMRGEYVAICEGDDYWTDPEKLQMQIDEMRKHSDCDISFHTATLVYQDKSRADKVFGRPRKGSGIIPLGEVIRGGGGFMPTASIVIAKEVLENFPEWFYNTAPIGDLFWQIYGSKRGGALFIDRNMAVYRAMAPGSWSQSMLDEKRTIFKAERIIQCLELIKRESGFEIYRKDIDYLKGLSILVLATFYLKNKSFKYFKQNIENSWAIFPNLNKKQLLLYKFKSLPLIPYLCYSFCIFFKKK